MARYQLTEAGKELLMSHIDGKGSVNSPVEDSRDGDATHKVKHNETRFVNVPQLRIEFFWHGVKVAFVEWLYSVDALEEGDSLSLINIEGKTGYSILPA